MNIRDTIMLVLLPTLISIIIGIIGYFLKQTMERVENTQILASKTKSQLDVLINDHNNKHGYLTEKFDDLKDSIVILTNEIKHLTAKIK